MAIEKLETLIKSDTTNKYDTPKKLNRSDKRIAPVVIDEIENGMVTCEQIEVLAKGFPIFRYKTCITIHGDFDFNSIPRIGGYKNVIQNQNKSVEIRYNAIDYDKKAEIARFCRFSSEFDTAGVKWSFNHNSQGTMFYYLESINKANFDEKRRKVLNHIERIKAVDFYGNVSAFRVNYYGEFYILVELRIDAIKREKVDFLTMAMLNINFAELKARRFIQAENERKAKAERERREQENQAAQKKANELKESLESKIKNFRAFNPASDTYGVKVTLIGFSQIGFKIVKNLGKASFGRIKAEYAFTNTLENFQALAFKPCKKELKKDEISELKSLR